jgi:hypothetical protein
MRERNGGGLAPHLPHPSSVYYLRSRLVLIHCMKWSVTVLIWRCAAIGTWEVFYLKQRGMGVDRHLISQTPSSTHWAPGASLLALHLVSLLTSTHDSSLCRSSTEPISWFI